MGFYHVCLEALLDLFLGFLADFGFQELLDIALAWSFVQGSASLDKRWNQVFGGPAIWAQCLEFWVTFPLGFEEYLRS